MANREGGLDVAMQPGPDVRKKPVVLVSIDVCVFIIAGPSTKLFARTCAMRD